MDLHAPPSDWLSEGPLVVAGLPEVAAALANVGYDPDAVRALLGVAGDITTTPADLAMYARRLAANPGALADLVAGFILGERLAMDRLAAALGAPALNTLVAARAVVETDGSGDPSVRLIPHGTLWLGADRRTEPDVSIDELYVTGINPPANLLAALTVNRDRGVALDVGTGNGIQSLLMAHHCERVVATDINPRALAFAAFNAALNGVDTIEFRQGNLLEPVAGERFDLIVCNPPYVISPDNDYVFRDSGREPGALCAELVGALPEHLGDDGYATVLASWPIRSDGSWSDVPRSWLADDCRAWLLQLSVDDAFRHARQWNASLAADGDVAAFGDAVDRWIGYTSALGIDQIGYGAVIVQHHVGPPTVVRADEVHAGHGNAGSHVERVFAAYDLLAELESDDSLGNLTCQVPAEHHVQRGIHLVEGEWRQGDAVITLAEGVGIEATLDPLMTEVFLRVTSGMTVRAAASEAGRFADVPLEHLDELISAAGAMVRDLLALGIVTA